MDIFIVLERFQAEGYLIEANPCGDNQYNSGAQLFHRPNGLSRCPALNSDF